ncbi:MAG: hypothetical protein Q9162_002512 [Coniocarpon cinnabarinum]
MDVFTKYFRRLVLQNASQIWHNARTDSSGSYPVLAGEVQKVATDPQQAAKIVESIEFGDRDGEIFKDFDMSAFMDNFQLKTVGKFSLASAFKRSSKADQRAKADGIMKNNIQPFLALLTDIRGTEGIEDPSPTMIASIIDHLAQYPPRDWTADNTSQLRMAVRQRFRAVNMAIPTEIQAALLLFDLLEQSNSLVKTVQRQGSRGAEKLERMRVLLDSVEIQDIGYQQVANVLLFMAIAADEPPYNMNNFISALREHRGGQRLDWQDVIGAFDREGVKVTRMQFKRLYDALIPLAIEYENFDIQQLWGGNWRHSDAQLAFVSAFLSFEPEELDATTIPRLRAAFTMEDFQDASEEIRSYAETAVKSPFVSLDGTRALFDMVFRSSDTYNHAQQLGVVERVINPHMDLFVVSVSAVPKPWGALQDQAVRQLVQPFFAKAVSGAPFVFHILWRRDKTWLAQRLKEFYARSPASIVNIFEHAVEHGWLEQLISFNNELSLDLATLAHGQNLFDLEQWLDELSKTMPGPSLLTTLGRFMKTRAQDDGNAERDQSESKTPVLSIKTVHTLLTFLGDAGLPEDDLIPLQRDCMHHYPRLINYGEGFDDIIDENSRDGHTLSSEADQRMQEHYERMYSDQVQVRDILTDLERYKSSRDPQEQELFACMIFGLFDEYNCFNGYPNSALAITAVLFGGIINCNLLSRIALKAALAMVLEAVRDYNASESMFKFGLQALLHFKDRLVEWKMFSERLLDIPALQETEIGDVTRTILQDSQELPNGETADQEQGDAMDDFLRGAPEPKVPEFTCLGVDSPMRHDYQDPSEQAQNQITFTLNNLSDRNLDSKFPELQSHIGEQNQQWLAHCLVDGLVKTQPNNQRLYMSVIDQFQDRDLWLEVLRQTFICSFRLLNAEKTIESSGDRTSLKNLADWLGAITLARNKPIKHRNISFKELLIEAHDTERLALAIPFTCRTLTGAAQSDVFRPPCAWTMDIVEVLVEIRRHLDNKVKTQHIFEIEKLLNDLGLSEKDVEASDAIRSRPPPDELALNALAEGADGFGDLTMARLARGAARSERLSPSLLPDVAEISNMLKHNYTLATTNTQVKGRMQDVLSQAVSKAIQDIIEPVVERSVTIAAISASQLIHKDFALEPDADRYEQSAHSAVRCLAGNLALVTCKEPLRSSIASNVRTLASDHFGDHVLTEGNVVLFVNDNLEAICSLIQKAAEAASIVAVNELISKEIHDRRNGIYKDQPISNWASHVPDPYKPSPGGLNNEQLAIYEDFGRTTRSNVAQTANASQEGPRQIPDVLQDQYGAMPSIPSVADNAALFRQGAPQGHGIAAQTRGTQPLVNGYSEGGSLQERMDSLHDSVVQVALAGLEEHPGKDLASLPSVYQAWQSLRAFIQRQAGNGFIQEKVAVSAAERFVMDLYNHEPTLPSPVVEVIAKVIMQLCELSDLVNKEISTWIVHSDERLSNPIITVAYLKAQLVDTRIIDDMMAPALLNKNQQALTFFATLVDRLLLSDPPIVLRADFARSMAAFGTWHKEEPDNTLLEDIFSKLQGSTTMPLDALQNAGLSNKEVQIAYVFEEWTKLQLRDQGRDLLTTFMLQLHQSKALATKEDYMLFIRVCLESAIAYHDDESRKGAAVSEGSFLKIDSLAKLVVYLAAFQGKANDSANIKKSEYFCNILSTFVLIFVKHYMNGAANAQRMFFRMIASVVSELQSAWMLTSSVATALAAAVGRSLMLVRPQHFPSFSFAFLDLLSHRTLMPMLMREPTIGWKTYRELLTMYLPFVCEEVDSVEARGPARELFRGTIELLLVLHHDFPDFLAKQHFHLLNAVPLRCAQLRSLIISATPTNATDMDEPFAASPGNDTNEDDKSAMSIREDVQEVLRSASILTIVTEYLQGSNKSSRPVDNIVQALTHSGNYTANADSSHSPADFQLFHALILHLVLHTDPMSPGTGISFNPASTQALLLDALVESLDLKARYLLISAIVDQLRWHNQHTNFFGLALLHLFHPRSEEKLTLEIQEQIALVLLERLVAHRPHSWGLMITTEELLKNRQHKFWDLPFVKKSPELERTPTPPPAVESSDEAGDEQQNQSQEETRSQEDADAPTSAAPDAEDNDDASDAGSEPLTASARKRAGRPLKIRPYGWDAIDLDVNDASESGTPGRRGRGRGRPGGTRGGPRLRGKKGATIPVTKPPLDDEGNEMEVVNDEIVRPGHPEGEKKVDKDGQLQGGREYRVRTFTLLGRDNRLYMLSTEPARCTGFRDSYLFFTKHKYLYKIIIGEDEKKDLIEREILPHSYKGRSIGVVAARSVYREFGSKIVVGGRKIIDDYDPDVARARGDLEGDLADPFDRIPEKGQGYNRNQYVAWHGASNVYHSSAPVGPLAAGSFTAKKRGGVISPTWMSEHAREASRFNSSLSAARKEAHNGVYDPHTNLMSYPQTMQPTHAIWEEVEEPLQQQPPKRRKLEHVNGDKQVLSNGFRTEDENVNVDRITHQSALLKPSSFLRRNYLIIDNELLTPQDASWAPPDHRYKEERGNSQNADTDEYNFDCIADAGFWAKGPPAVSDKTLATFPPDARESYLQERKLQGAWQDVWRGSGAVRRPKIGIASMNTGG